MNNPQLPFAEPPHTRHWALVDVVAAGLTSMAWTTQIAASGPITPMGPGWTAGRYLAAGAGCASIYAVVSASARRAAPVIVGTAVAAMEAGAAMATGGPDAAAVLSAPALAVVGWLAAENVRARRAYEQGVADRAAERAREQTRRASAE